jgi:hypothetical protein
MSYIRGGARVFSELWISLFPWLLSFAKGEKTLNSKNGTLGDRLTRHRVKLGCPFKLFCHEGTLFVEVSQLNCLIVDPVSESFVSDKLGCADRFVDDPLLLRFAFQLEL